MSIKFITDSASDMIDGSYGEVSFVPLTVRFDETDYLDGVNISHTEFYERLINSRELPITSQASPYVFEQEYKKARENNDTVIVVTMSSKLSGTYQSAVMAAGDYEDMVYVVDSENVTVGEYILIRYGIQLKNKGLDAKAIVTELEKAKKKIHLVGLLDTLEYLKKGGRISKTVAFAGGMLGIKPVIAIENGEVIMLGKARGSKQGNNLLIEQINKAGGIDYDMPYMLGYTGLSDELLQRYINDNEALWRSKTDSLEQISVGAAIGTHVGPGAIAIAFFEK